MRRRSPWMAIAAFCVLLPGRGVAETAPPSAPTPTMIELERQMTDVVERVRPSIVTIVGEKPTPPTVERTGRPLRHVSVASGVALDSLGHVLTTASVTRAGRVFRVMIAGEEYPADVVAEDPLTQISLLLVHDAPPLTPIRLGSMTDLHIGSWVFLVGAAAAETPTAFGAVSSLPRPEDDPGSHFLATTATMTPGLTGAALVNSRGELVGLAYAAVIARPTAGPGADAERSSASRAPLAPSSTSLAIPIDSIREVKDLIEKRGTIARAFLGVRWNPDQASDVQATTLPEGVQVWDVLAGSPAEKAGIRKGDLITHWNGQAVRSGVDLRALVLAAAPGETASVGLTRDGAPLTLPVLLAPLSAARTDAEPAGGER